MWLSGLKDEFILLSKKQNVLNIYIGKNQRNLLIFHSIEEPRKPAELINHIKEEEKAYLYDKLNHEQDLVVYISKLPLIGSSFILFYQSFDDVFHFIIDSMHEELLEYIRKKKGTRIFEYMVVKEGVIKEVPYF